MNERLDKLCFLPPPTGTPWSGPPRESVSSQIHRNDGQSVDIEVPLFWYDPAWSRIGADVADAIATAVGQHGVLVSALRSDLSGPDQQPAFHGASPDANEDEKSENDGADASQPPLARIVPYRPERYGLCDADFDNARIIDLRLTLDRDAAGRFAFSPDQIERWEATPASQPLAGGSWVPAATFPPDVISLPHLSNKLNQLRVLSPSAAVFVAMGAHRLELELTEVLATKPDGLILRVDDLNLPGLQLALMTMHARQLADRSGAKDLPIWIVAGEITPDDAAKLVALGASAVAIDSWCDPIIEEAETQIQQSSSYGYSSRSSKQDAYLVELVEDELAARLERFKGLLNSFRKMPTSQRVGSLCPTWAEALGIRTLSLPSVSGG